MALWVGSTSTLQNSFLEDAVSGEGLTEIVEQTFGGYYLFLTRVLSEIGQQKVSYIASD